ncbi:MAG: D-alanine--D-alanine ligase [Candidatus Azobacteroides pseudotrichonymphae]|jgi:D-alanine-D-alanine ligase|nr:D-alanine--D-alanine ligase [Bacteroidales bacterium OttesenSCG-928-I14]GMO35669.1 MAG: D-alanine--D-alanine ligase [Candidatus Azobacteroides pseudotrichonymphae]
MKNVAIVSGGYSSECVISLKSAEEVYLSIDKTRYNPYIVLITRNGWTVQGGNKTEFPINKNDFSFIYKGKQIRFDFAYIIIHGTPGEDGLLQGYLDILNIPYSCCGVLSASITFNKYFCNNYLRGFGVETAKSILLKQREQIISPERIIDKLGLPLIVKPNDGGSSFGVTKVTNITQIQLAIRNAFNEGEGVLIESFIPGTEITCGYYKTKNKQVTLPITEIISKNDFFDFEAKYNPGMVEEITPARISKKLTDEIQTLTAHIYDWVGAKGIIRIDYIISPEKEIKMLEVNTIPGMTATSFIPQQIRAAGLNLKEILTEIIESI